MMDSPFIICKCLVIRSLILSDVVVLESTQYSRVCELLYFFDSSHSESTSANNKARCQEYRAKENQQSEIWNKVISYLR